MQRFRTRSRLHSDFFDVSRFFANGEKGAWYDPSDWSTLFQDSAGTTPVTAVNDPVGLMLDRATAIGTAGDVSPSLTSLAGWGTSGTPLYGSVSLESGGIRITALGGGMIALFLPFSTTAVAHRVSLTIQISSGTFFAEHGAGGSSVSITTSGTYNYINTQNRPFYIRTSVAGSALITGLTITEVPGYPAWQTTAINRPTLAQDANGKYRLDCNGTNSRMRTLALNMGANALSVFAAVYKASDASAGMIVELSADASANNGAFYIEASDGAAGNYRVLVRGSAADGATPAIAAPDTSVISVVTQTGLPGTFLMRRDGVEVANSAPSFGTVNFGNYPIYLGARNASTLHFNGGLYGLIIRSAISTTAEIETAEKYMNFKSASY